MSWASMVVQRLRIHLPVQGSWVQSLVWEESTCHGATKPMCHNYWAQVREATAVRSLCTAAGKEPHSPQLEEAHIHSKDPVQPKYNFFQKRWKRSFPCGSLTSSSMSPGLSGCLMNLYEWRNESSTAVCMVGPCGSLINDSWWELY